MTMTTSSNEKKKSCNALSKYNENCDPSRANHRSMNEPNKIKKKATNWMWNHGPTETEACHTFYSFFIPKQYVWIVFNKRNEQKRALSTLDFTISKGTIHLQTFKQISFFTILLFPSFVFRFAFLLFHNSLQFGRCFSWA